jgi:hypothetical protein
MPAPLLSAFVQASPPPHAKVFTRCRAEARASNTCPNSAIKSRIFANKFPRPTVPLRSAPHRPAKSPLAFSSVATIAGNAAASFAGSTRATASASMSSRAFIQKATGTVHAIVATAHSASGSTSGPAAPTARAQTAAAVVTLRHSPSRLLRQQSVQRIPAWAVLRRASKAHGTGALSKHTGVSLLSPEPTLNIFMTPGRTDSFDPGVPSFDDIRTWPSIA